MRAAEVARRIVLATTLGCAGGALRADVDFGEYRPKSALSDPQTQLRYRQEIAREQAEAERRTAEAAERERQAALARQQAEAARPWPERLTERHCTRCHAARNYTSTTHTPAGWAFVIMRMKWLNQAPLFWGEAVPVWRYLNDRFPARGSEAAFEWLLAATLFGAPLVALALTIYWRRRNRKWPGCRVRLSFWRSSPLSARR